MPQQPPQLPPPNVMVQELRTPNPVDVYYRELVQRDSPRWMENNPIARGTRYSTLRGADKGLIQKLGYRELYFLSESVPIGSNTVASMTQHMLVIWNWMTAPLAESQTNADISYLGDATGNPVYARTYIVRRKEYEDNPYFQTQRPLKALIGGRIINGGTGYTKADATLLGPGSDSGAQLRLQITDGEITDVIVEYEGDDFDTTSVINIVGDGKDALILPVVQGIHAVLTSQKKTELAPDDPRSAEFIRVVRIYETLPGPWIPFTRYDDNLGPIQGRRRAVINQGELGGGVTATGSNNYEGREGSSVVSLQIQENWSNGTGSGIDNPTYPVHEDDYYDRNDRGPVHRERQVVVATGAEIGGFVRSPLGGSRNLVTHTNYEAYPNNPFLLIRVIETWTEVVTSDRRIGGLEFGGGLTRIDRQTAEPGVQSAQVPEVISGDLEGYRTLVKTLETTSPHEQTLKQEQLIESYWPLMRGTHTDEVTGIVVNFTKQIVPSNTPYPGRSGYRGPFIEIQPHDRWRSIYIATSVDCNTLPADEEWEDTLQISLPDTLLSIQAIWSDVISKSASANRDDVSVRVSSGASGSIIVRSKNGFRGHARARVKRQFKCGPFTPAEVAGTEVFKIIPSSGSAILIEADSKTFASADSNNTGTFVNTAYGSGSINGGLVGDEFHRQIRAIDIRDHIVGSFDIIDANHSIREVDASAQSSGGLVRQAHIFPSAVLLENRCRMIVDIPISVPAVLPTVNPVLWRITVEEWRFGVWVMHKYYVYLAGL